MKVIILAGGIGKRMAPIRKDKSLLKFLGKPLLMHQIEKLESAGLNEFIVICNPQNIDEIRALVGKKAEYVVQKEPKGMADALLSVENPPEEAMIVSAHDIFDKEAYEAVLAKEGDSVVLGYKTDKYFPGGYLIVDGDRMKGIIEKPGEGKEPSNLVNIVVHLHRKFHKFIECMKGTKSDKDDVYEVSMDKMIKDGADFRIAEYKGRWVAIKYPHNIINAMDYFLENIERRISPNASISDRAVIDGNVVIESGARVFEGAVIRGPCYIGKNCVIGNNCLVWGGVNLNDNDVLGFSTEMKHSFVGDNTWFHQNYIGDSIISDNCNFGAKTTTANWRFDQKEVKVKVGDSKISTGTDKFGCIVGENCKTGILASIMPGVKIGPDSIIGPGVAAFSDIGPGKIVMLKQETAETRDNPIKAGADKSKLVEKMKRGTGR